MRTTSSLAKMMAVHLVRCLAQMMAVHLVRCLAFRFQTLCFTLDVDRINSEQIMRILGGTGLRASGGYERHDMASGGLS